MSYPKAARRLGAETQFSATQSAKALDVYSRANFRAAQAIAALPGTATMAIAGDLDLPEAAETSAKLLNIFGLMTEDSVQLGKNMNRVASVIVSTANSSVTSVQALTEAMKHGGKTFANAGADIETTAAFLGILANNAKEGELAGTAARNVMMRLISPTKKMRDIMGALGVEVGEDGVFKDAATLMVELSQSLSRFDKVTKTDILGQMFQMRAGEAALSFIDKGADQIIAMRKQITGTEDEVKRISMFMQTSLPNRFLIFRSALIEASFKALEPFRLQIEMTMDKMTEFVRNVDVSSIVFALKGMWVWAKSMHKAMIPIFKMMPFFLRALPFMLGMFTAIKAVQLGVAVFHIASAMFTLAKAVAASNAMWLIANATILGTPVGWILLAVTAVVAAIAGAAYLIYKNFDKIKTGFAKMIDSIKMHIRSFMDSPITKSFFKGLAFVVPGGPALALRGALADRQTPAPNSAEVDARRRSEFYGRIDINGAPPGSSARVLGGTGTGIDMELLGAN